MYGCFKWPTGVIAHEKTRLKMGNLKKESESLQVAGKNNFFRTNFVKVKTDYTQKNINYSLYTDGLAYDNNTVVLMFSILSLIFNIAIFFPTIWGPFQMHQLQLVSSPSNSCSSEESDDHIIIECNKLAQKEIAGK